MTQTFTAMGIRPELVRILQRNGVTAPTPVQQEAIMPLMEGNDAIVQAQTGTGKTLTFVLPILEKIDPGKSTVQALIITPTRELAIQIAAEMKKLAPACGASVLAAYGGQDVEAQIRKLQGSPHIVVGTPGRLLDHLRRGTIHFTNLSVLVLDEADQMLAMGFLGEVEELIGRTAASRQTMLFSATIPDSVRKLAAKYMRSPRDIRVRTKQITLAGIKQLVVETTDRGKLQTLIQMIETDQPFLAVVFCRTKIRAKMLTEKLLRHGMNVDELHGDLSQAERERVMARFRRADLQILVATDVAARGLDVEGITHVFNYDIPQDPDSYIHRIGRTGRAGKTGMAITFASPRDRALLQQIERAINARLERRSMHEFGDKTIETRGNERKENARSGKTGGRTRNYTKTDAEKGRRNRNGARASGRAKTAGTAGPHKAAKPGAKRAGKPAGGRRGRGERS